MVQRLRAWGETVTNSDNGTTPERPIVFISHHSSHEQSARRLKQILERNGLVGRMVPADVPPGKAFDEAIVEQIGRSDIVALLFSRTPMPRTM